MGPSMVSVLFSLSSLPSTLFLLSTLALLIIYGRVLFASIFYLWTVVLYQSGYSVESSWTLLQEEVTSLLFLADAAPSRL